MRTILTKDPAEAAEFIKNVGICAFPTETVYGLGANVFNESAISKIFEAKQRPSDNPLIAHVSSIDQIAQLSTDISANARKFIEAFFPGPLTIVVPKSARVPHIATANLETIGVRMPRFKLAHEFIEFCGVPIVAPSANISGRPSPTTWQAVFEDLNGRIDCILQGEPTEIGLESTVVDCTREMPIVLRKGSISLDQLQKIVPETSDYESDESEPPRSPGMKHRHYSPLAHVRLVGPDAEISETNSAAFIGLENPAWEFALVRICASVEEYARSVFAFFRECDAKRIETIYCQAVPESGIGAALMDRLRRAAE